MSDIAFWEQRYSTDDYVFGTEPNAFLLSQAERFRPGMRVLAVADGEGRNGVWLAQKGLSVVSIDGSERALEKARRLAAERGVKLETVAADLATWAWPTAAFDAIVAIFIQFAGPPLRDRLFAGMLAALRPGGLLLLHGYRPEQIAYGTGGPRAPENLYTEAWLRQVLAPMASVEIRSYDTEIVEGSGHRGMSALIDCVATKGGG